eukprot:2664177-Pleurochrysis_carterae.AAC.2
MLQTYAMKAEFRMELLLLAASLRFRYNCAFLPRQPTEIAVFYTKLMKFYFALRNRDARNQPGQSISIDNDAALISATHQYNNWFLYAFNARHDRCSALCNVMVSPFTAALGAFIHVRFNDQRGAKRSILTHQFNAAIDALTCSASRWRSRLPRASAAFCSFFGTSGLGKAQSLLLSLLRAAVFFTHRLTEHALAPNNRVPEQPLAPNNRGSTAERLLDQPLALLQLKGAFAGAR